MQDRMARLFGDVYLRDEDTGFRGSWMPPVDIFETEQPRPRASRPSCRT